MPFLAVWDCQLGKPKIDPPNDWKYKPSEWFLIDCVSDTNTIPDDIQYPGNTGTTGINDDIENNGVFYFNTDHKWEVHNKKWALEELHKRELVDMILSDVQEQVLKDDWACKK